MNSETLRSDEGRRQIDTLIAEIADQRKPGPDEPDGFSPSTAFFVFWFIVAMGLFSLFMVLE